MAGTPVVDSEAELEEPTAPVLPYPLCGCCRQRVRIDVFEGKPYRQNGVLRTPKVDRVRWSCRCQELLAQASCFFCHRCRDCCRCSSPYFVEAE